LDNKILTDEVRGHVLMTVQYLTVISLYTVNMGHEAVKIYDSFTWAEKILANVE
jgi:hypothetical protein